MTLDPAAKRFLLMAAAGRSAADGATSIEARRLAWRRLMRLGAAERLSPAGLDGVLPGPAGDLAYRLYRPTEPGKDRGPGIVFFHGGGLTAGDLDSHDLVCRALCEESGCRVVAVAYRLAPEHPFPAAIDDAICATRWVLGGQDRLDIDPTRLAVAGDSAGATLAAVVCQQARAWELPQIAAQCLICPVLDSAAQSPSRRDFASGYLVDTPMLAADLADYLPEGIEAADPRVSPLRAADLAGLPRAIVHTAWCDPMRDEGNAYARELSYAGIAVSHVCHPGMIHNFHALGAIIPAGKAALRQIGAELHDVLAPQSRSRPPAIRA
jgi:acetyl esterase